MLLAASGSAYALGFGTLSLHSRLHERLRADVPLLLDGAADIKKVHVALASKAEYRQLGIAWQPELAQLQVTVERRGVNDSRVRIRSQRPVASPLLSILLKADKGGRGTYLKDFQVMLDAAGTLLRPPAAAQSAASSAAATTDDGWARIWRYGPVRAGDSLSEIAYRLRKDKRFTNRQVMISLYEQNPHSFVDGDINQLKRGVWLDVPRGEVVKTYANRRAMLKLTRLLHTGSHRTVARQHARKTRTRGEPSTPAAQPHLRFSGKIGVQAASGVQASELMAVKQTMGDQFERLHQEMMHGKLQMTGLHDTVKHLSQSVAGIQKDIRTLKHDIAFIKAQRMQSQREPLFSDWQLLLLVLLTSFLGAFLAVLVRRKMAGGRLPQLPLSNGRAEPAQRDVKGDVDVKSEPQIDLTADLAAVSSIPQLDAPRRPVAASQEGASEDVDHLLNRIEAAIGGCHFDEAESLLHAVSQRAPDSLRALVLKAQLLHETDRYAERDALITAVSESSESGRWESFCEMLPAHVWHACFGEDGMMGSGV